MTTLKKKDKKEKPRIPCEHCEKLFTQKRVNQRFCTSRCQMQEWARMNPRIKVTKLYELKQKASGETE